MGEKRGAKRMLISAAVCATLGLAVAALWLPGADERTLDLLRVTADLVIRTAALCVPLGAALGLLLFRTDLPGRRLYLTALAVMLCVPLYLQVAGWDAGFGKQGWYSLFTESLAQPPLRGLRGAVWVHAMAGLPWVVLMVGVGLRFVEPELEEQVLLESGQGAVIRHVILPRILPAIGAAVLWVTVSTAGEMTVADMYLLPTYTRELYTGMALGDDLQSASRQAIPGTALVLLLAAATLALVAYLAPPAGRTSGRSPRQLRLGPWRWPLSLAVLLLVLLTAAVPLGNLVYKAGMVVRAGDGQLLREWSAAAFAETVLTSPPRFAENHGWTLLIGGLTAAAALAIAVPLAWYARHAGWAAVPALVAVVVGFAFPAPLLALLLIGLLDRPDVPLFIWLYDDTLFAPVATLTVRVLPLIVLMAWYGVRTLSTDVLDNALVDGANAWRRFWHIVVPQRVPVWWLAGLFAFVLASGDLAASILIVPPGVMTIPIRVFGLIHAGVDDQVAGICLTTAAAYVLLALLATQLVRRLQPHGW